MRYSVSLTGALLLAAFFGGAANPASADYAPVTPDLDLVASDCDGFATVRVAQLADKLALKKVSDLPLLGNLEKKTGLRLVDIERVTLVVCAESHEFVGLIHTLRPCDRSHIVKALAPEDKEVKYRGKVFHADSSDDQAVCFLDDHLILIGSVNDLKQILGKKNERETTGPLAEALARAATHDVVAWGRVIEPKEEPASTRSSYKTSRAPTKKVILGTLVSPAGPSMLPGATSADLTLDVGKQLSLQVCIHFADEENAQRGVKYVRVGVEMVRAMLATQSAAQSRLEVADDLGIEKDGPEILPALAIFMKKTEKAMQRVKVEAHGTTVPVSLTVPADAKTVASTALALLKLADQENTFIPGYLPSREYLTRPPAFFPHLSESAAQEDALGGGLIGAALWGVPGGPRHPLAGAAIGGAVGAGTGAVIGNSQDKAEQRVAVAQAQVQARMLGLTDVATMTQQKLSDDVIIGQIRSTGSVFRLSAIDLQWLHEIGMSDRVITEMQATAGTPRNPLAGAAIGGVVGSTSVNAPAAEPLSPPRESTTTTPAGDSPTQTVAVSVAPMKLAIANVAKEPALLFLQGKDGKLTFQQKLPAGEAIDVDTTPGQRWVAIFAENPASEDYVATPEKTTWLLRGTPQPSDKLQGHGAPASIGGYPPAR